MFGYHYRHSSKQIRKESKEFFSGDQHSYSLNVALILRNTSLTIFSGQVSILEWTDKSAKKSASTIRW